MHFDDKRNNPGIADVNNSLIGQFEEGTDWK